ncbi:MAG: 1-deoxy-D-xylulose-5-phosphate reductoisomerase [Chlamydiota bacterium]|nr:1-deoxy-D-xylulose-5-phosphate reductoisomerase [Chlamydiota bacterium]
MTKNISILGSTGSIGTNTLKVVENLGVDNVKVTALAAGSNIDLLEKQAQKFRPNMVAVFNKAKAKELQQRLPQIEVVAGLEGIIAAATHSSTDLVVSSMVGTLGLIPTVAAIEAKKDIALANKEALVSGGALVMALAKKNNVKILPVDSEHSAIFQCLNGEEHKNIDRIILTSSGGPFRKFPAEQLKTITVEDALNHPTWTMGPKVTIDSSTLMNKGLEVIEAHWLFDIPTSKIDVVIHPQSIIHSMIEYIDGSVIAQMSKPTMLVPIQYALTYPDRKRGLIERFDFTKHGILEFYQPNTDRFRCLQLAFDSLDEGDSMPCYMNAANEVLVERFLDKQISWQDISQKLESLMQKHQKKKIEMIDDVIGIDTLARQEALEI